MDASNNSLKRTRVRLCPNKRWALWEEQALIKFLIDNPDFERPTAQVYYKRYLKDNKVDAEWTIVRSKVRNMRYTYGRAKAWKSSVEGGKMTDEQTSKDSIHQMCSYFNEFEKIFGNRYSTASVVNDSLESDSCQFENYFNSATTQTSPIRPTTANEKTPDENPIESDSSSIEDICENLPSTSRKKLYSKTGVSDIFQTAQMEMIQLKRQQMANDLVIKKKELKLTEREIVVKEKEMELKEKELNLKETELHSQEKLKILELELKERLAMKELELKYGKKNNNGF